MESTTKLWTIEDIKAANERAGFFFFEPATLRFFRSRVHSDVYQGPGGVYFVTSEQFRASNGYTAPRLFTVRRFDPETGSADTEGEFQAYGTRGKAHRAAQGCAARTEEAA